MRRRGVGPPVSAPTVSAPGRGLQAAAARVAGRIRLSGDRPHPRVRLALWAGSCYYSVKRRPSDQPMRYLRAAIAHPMV